MGFHTVVLCAEEYQPEAEVFAPARILRVPLRDETTPFDFRTKKQLLQAGDVIAKRVRAGEMVLVSCALGRNRSALVGALAVAALCNMRPRDAGKLIRKRRKDQFGVSALENRYFRLFLQELG